MGSAVWETGTDTSDKEAVLKTNSTFNAAVTFPILYVALDLCHVATCDIENPVLLLRWILVILLHAW